MKNPDNNHSGAVLDENTRRYYLDAMGIQCWQPIASESAASPTLDVVEQNIADQQDKTEQPEVLSRGNENADMMFVLMAPGQSDIKAGELCSGEEGVLLTKMLAAINVSIADVYITSLLQTTSTGADVSESEITQCNLNLKQQVLKVKPKVLVALGEAAAQFLLQQKLPLDNLREKNNSVDKNSHQLAATFESVPVFVSYSPAELLQKTEDKRKAWLDLQKFQKLLRKLLQTSF